MDLSFAYPKSNLKWLPERTIFLTKHGSQAYGTATPTSDTDYKGVAVPPAQYFHGYTERFEQAEFHGDPDMVVFEVRKFIKLAADCNPSVIEVLFTDPSDHVILRPLGMELLLHRKSFLSKKAKHTFSGYAVSQLKRIQGHHRWLVNPPQRPPTRADLGLPERTVIPADQLMAAESMIKKKLEEWNVPLDELDEAGRIAVQGRLAQLWVEVGQVSQATLAGRSLGFSDNFLALLDMERGYNARKIEWDQYQTWLKTRNPARAALEAKWGYDTKHGMHLVRLMRMGREILTTGEVIVKRPDAEELLAIRNGLWTYEQLIEWAEKEEAALDALYKTSNALPMTPDRALLDRVCCSIVEKALERPTL